jgi:hypothetical protein
MKGADHARITVTDLHNDRGIATVIFMDAGNFFHLPLSNRVLPHYRRTGTFAPIKVPERKTRIFQP